MEVNHGFDNKYIFVMWELANKNKHGHVLTFYWPNFTLVLLVIRFN